MHAQGLIKHNFNHELARRINLVYSLLVVNMFYLVLAVAIFVLRKGNVLKESNETAIEVMRISTKREISMNIIHLGDILGYFID